MAMLRGLLARRELRLIFGITFMAVLGVSSIVGILPAMAEDLVVSRARIGLAITAFTLPGVLLTPLLGIASDRFGRKTVLLPALGIFAVAGTACTLAPDFTTLLVLRALQGVGAAPLGMLSATLIGDFFAGPDLAEAMGYNASCLSMGTAVFPLLGGLLGLIGWRWTFLLPILAVPVAIALAVALPEPARGASEDFGRYMRQVMVRMRTPAVLGIFACALAVFVMLYGPIITFLPILLAERFAVSPAIIGAVVALASLVAAVAASRLGSLSARYGERRLVQAGFACYAVALSLIPLAGNLGWLLLPVSIFGIAQGLTMPGVITILNRQATGTLRGAFNAVFGLLMRLGQTLGPLMAGLAYVLFAGGAGVPVGAEHVGPGNGAGLAAVYVAGALLAGVMVVIAGMLLPDN